MNPNPVKAARIRELDATIVEAGADLSAAIDAAYEYTARIYVPMGDTALIRGVASAAKQLKPSISIVGVVAERAPAYFQSWRQRRAIETESADTIADGLAVRRALAPNVSAICDLVDEVWMASEEELLAAIGHLLRHEHVTAEPAAAATTASFLKEPHPSRTSVLLVTGGNIAPEIAARG